MKVSITPGKANGLIQAPPSKSMAHRMLIGAGLAKGISIINNITLSEDIKATLSVLKALGSEYKIEGNSVVMKGIGHGNLKTEEVLDCRESGSTLRFFIPLLLTGGQRTKFIGAKRLMERPLTIYENICKEQGVFHQRTEEALVLEGVLKATHFKVPGNVSSQFVTGLLYALPLLEEDSVVEVLPPIESKAYIDMTLEALKYYGICIERKENTFFIAGGQTYVARDCVVEGDYSNAAFLEAFNLIGGNVSVEGLKEDSLQGDRIYKKYYELLKNENPVLDIAECPDLGPILMGMAAALHGAKITGTRRLKIKESDRGAVMAEELLKFGIKTKVLENEIIVFEGELREPNEILCSHNDHRIVMTLTTLCTIIGGMIDGAEAVRKSFPDYYDVIKNLGIQVTRED